MVPELLGLQKPQSDPAHHDEPLFIVIHQVYELWFKLVLHEVDAAVQHVDADRLYEANRLLRRVVEIQRLLVQHTPVLGVCLGAQLLAKAAVAPVYRAEQPEVGWFEVELTSESADDPVFSRLPDRFEAFQWHYYTYDLPGGALELARSSRCTQAFRLGDSAWGIQFHAEVTLGQVESWLEHEVEDEDREHLPADFLETTRERIEQWNELGRTLCGSFVEAAERVAAPV
jgi:GMP synthase-like glutamine amidotransferase